jgi:hypothetical protein
MRRLLMLVLFAGLACAAKKDKKPPEPAAAPPPPAAEAAPEPEAEPTPPPEVKNADMYVSIRSADGQMKKGHVKKIERSVDWFADQGWTDDAKDLKITIESAGKERDITWSDVAAITIKPGPLSDVDCVYDSQFTPWMYDCTLKTTATLKTKDGATGLVTNRHKWKFTFDDDSTDEFWLFKHPARQQDDREIDIDSTEPENVALYKTLSQRLKLEAATSLVVSITIP